jgi:hypothetical protein
MFKLFIVLGSFLACCYAGQNPPVKPSKGGVWPKPQQQETSENYLVLLSRTFSFKVKQICRIVSRIGSGNCRDPPTSAVPISSMTPSPDTGRLSPLHRLWSSEGSSPKWKDNPSRSSGRLMTTSWATWTV